MREYLVNSSLRRAMIKIQHKKHPVWEKRKFFRWSLFILGIIISLIIGALFTIKELSLNSFIDLFGNERVTGYLESPIWMFLVTSLCMVGIFEIPFIAEYTFKKKKCRDGIDSKIKEVLITSDKEIINGFLITVDGNDNKTDPFYRENIIKYSTIKRVVYNEYFNCLDIYSRYLQKSYQSRDKVGLPYENGIKGNDVKLRFYLYYDNSEEFIKEIVEKSNVKLEVTTSKE